MRNLFLWSRPAASSTEFCWFFFTDWHFAHYILLMLARSLIYCLLIRFRLEHYVWQRALLSVQCANIRWFHRAWLIDTILIKSSTRKRYYPLKVKNAFVFKYESFWNKSLYCVIYKAAKVKGLSIDCCGSLEFQLPHFLCPINMNHMFCLVSFISCSQSEL